VGHRLEPAPARIVVALKVAESARLILIVSQSEHRGGIELDQQVRGRQLLAGRARRAAPPGDMSPATAISGSPPMTVGVGVAVAIGESVIVGVEVTVGV
jgi:hypothetical protein